MRVALWVAAGVSPDDTTDHRSIATAACVRAQYQSGEEGVCVACVCVVGEGGCCSGRAYVHVCRRGGAKGVSVAAVLSRRSR